MLVRVRLLPLDPFRISYAYTNFGYTAGAEAVAASAGKSWEDLADQVLFSPLGMASTSYRFANGSYDGKQIVDAKALLPAVTPQVVSSPATEPAMRSGFYGHGFNVGSTSAARMELSHSGAFELGAGTNILLLPSADVAIVELTNATPAGIPETLTAEFADLVQFGEVREDWYKLYTDAFEPMGDPEGSLVGQQPPAAPAPAAPLPSYVGDYNNDYWGPARVTEKDGMLQLALGTKLNVPLNHWDGNVFTYSWVSENSPPGSVGKAAFDGDKLTLEYYDTGNRGTFTRGAPS